MRSFRRSAGSRLNESSTLSKHYDYSFWRFRGPALNVFSRRRSESLKHSSCNALWIAHSEAAPSTFQMGERCLRFPIAFSLRRVFGRKLICQAGQPMFQPLYSIRPFVQL